MRWKLQTPSYGHQMNNKQMEQREEFLVLSEVIGGKEFDAEQD